MKKLGLYLSILFLWVILLENSFAQEEEIFFDPDPLFSDYEFEELQRAYLASKDLSITEFKTIPLNEFSDRFIEKLIKKISEDVKADMKEEIIDYLENLLQEKKKSEQITSISSDASSPEKETPKEEATKVKLKSSDKDTTLIQSSSIASISEKDARAKLKKNNRIRRVDFADNTAYININSLSKNNIHIVLDKDSQVHAMDVSIFIKNIRNNMTYLLKRYPNYTFEGSTHAIDYSWVRPKNIPYGEYKLFVTVKFIGVNEQPLFSETKYWGDSKANNIYTIFKN